MKSLSQKRHDLTVVSDQLFSSNVSSTFEYNLPCSVLEDKYKLFVLFYVKYKSCIQISSNKMHIKYTTMKVPTVSVISSYYLFIIIDFFLHYVRGTSVL